MAWRGWDRQNGRARATGARSVTARVRCIKVQRWNARTERGHQWCKRRVAPVAEPSHNAPAGVAEWAKCWN